MSSVTWIGRLASMAAPYRYYGPRCHTAKWFSTFLHNARDMLWLLNLGPKNEIGPRKCIYAISETMIFNLFLNMNNFLKFQIYPNDMKIELIRTSYMKNFLLKNILLYSLQNSNFRIHKQNQCGTN